MRLIAIAVAWLLCLAYLCFMAVIVPPLFVCSLFMREKRC